MSALLHDTDQLGCLADRRAELRHLAYDVDDAETGRRWHVDMTAIPLDDEAEAAEDLERESHRAP